MGNTGICSSEKLANQRSNELRVLFLQTDTSIDFYKKMDKLFESSGSTLTKHTASALTLSHVTLRDAKNYKARFFVVAFTLRLIAHNKNIPKKFSSSSLSRYLIKDLELELPALVHYIDAERPHSWRQRYYLAGFEVARLVAQSSDSNAAKYKSLQVAMELYTKKELFYAELSHQSVKECRNQIGKLIRRAALQSQK